MSAKNEQTLRLIQLSPDSPYHLLAQNGVGMTMDIDSETKTMTVFVSLVIAKVSPVHPDRVQFINLKLKQASPALPLDEIVKAAEKADAAQSPVSLVKA